MHHEQALREFDGELWTSTKSASQAHHLNFVESEPGGGISPRAGVIRQGGNSGFQAVGLALLMGAARVILLGYDMQHTGGKSHWHGDHRGLGNPLKERMVMWRQRFLELSQQTNVPILNATRQTALTCFPKLDLNESLAESEACRS